jgi:LacI family gluconate utilization system Gnt-I transcriptional repressor
VPEDIAVLGFGDTVDSRFTHPSLSTISVNSSTMGKSIADSLLNRFAGVISALQVDSGFRLIERAST